MFVCSNRKIAYAFYQIIVGMRPEWAEKKVCPDGVQLTEKEKKELKPIEKIKLIMTRNKDDEPELYEMLGTKDDRKEFDRQFKNVKSNFKIAIVVDMWLTGFDVPALDTIYIDKPINTIAVVSIAAIYMPVPHARPIAAVTHKPAAVVRPRTTFF